MTCFAQTCRNSGGTNQSHKSPSGWWFVSTPLKNDGIRQLGWFSIPIYDGKIYRTCLKPPAINHHKSQKKITQGPGNQPFSRKQKPTLLRKTWSTDPSWRSWHRGRSRDTRHVPARCHPSLAPAISMTFVMGKAGKNLQKNGKSRESLGTIWENLMNMWKR